MSENDITKKTVAPAAADSGKEKAASKGKRLRKKAGESAGDSKLKAKKRNGPQRKKSKDAENASVPVPQNEDQVQPVEESGTRPYEGEVREYEAFENTYFNPDASSYEFKSHDERIAVSEAIRKEREERVEKGKQEALDEMELKRAAKYEGRVEHGTLVGIEPYPSGYSAMCAVVMFNNRVKVYIPFTEMYCLPLERGENDTDEAMEKRQLELIKCNLWSNISYQITLVSRDPESGELFAMGSRRKALLIEQQKYYYPTKTRPEPYYKVGNIYEAEVIASGKYGIFVNLGGVDTQISIRFLSHRYMEYAYDMYSVGSKIKVKLLEVTKNKNPRTGLNIVVNAKEAEKIHYPDRIRNNIIVGGIYVARVVVIKANKEKTPMIHLWIEHANVPATAKFARISGTSLPLSKGSLVSVQIDSSDPDKSDVRCTIHRVLNNSPSTFI